MTTSTFSVSRRSFTIFWAVSTDRERYRAGAIGIKLRFLAEQSDDAKTNTAALDDDVAANQAIFGEALETDQ